MYYMDRLVKKNEPPPSMGDILVEAGYKESIRSQPAKVMNTPAWKEFLNELDDSKIVQKWHNWALDDDPSLRNSALRAGENIMKLKKRWPEEKGKVAHVHAELKDLMEEEPSQE